MLLSAKRVGPTGKAYGLNMTDEMLALAEENKRKAGVENVEFLKGESENIPLPNNSVDTIPVQHFVAPAFVIDCSEQVKHDPDYLLTVQDIEKFEKAHGRITPGAWVLMRTDWSKRQDPEAYQNFDEQGQHTPGPSSEAAVRGWPPFSGSVPFPPALKHAGGPCDNCPAAGW